MLDGTTKPCRVCGQDVPEGRVTRMNGQRMHKNTRHASGFSLVEVLISIFVLALGLLGVAAVFPAVVRQQRVATDSVQGISIQRSVEELIRGNALLSRSDRPVLQGGTIISEKGGWALIAADQNFSSEGEWSLSNLIESGSASDSGISVNIRNGDMFVGGTGAFGTIQIPVAERLIPRPSISGDVQPRFVWDFVARRVAAGERPLATGGTAAERRSRFDDDTLQLAVFVRRIDTGIRVPSNQTLGSMLTAANPVIVPVAEEDTGRPTFDGVGRGNQPRYSPIRLGGVRVVLDQTGRPQLNVITVQSPSVPTALRPYVEQLGQKLVDARGVVHEVVRLNRDVTPAQLTIDPPLAQGLALGDGAAPVDAEVFYTTQTPASVSIVTIRR